MKTPKYKKSETVYPPSEDTFILLDALEKDIGSLQLNLKNDCEVPLVCELGVGSGIVSIFLESLLALENRKALYLGIDLNNDALLNTETNRGLNNKEMVLEPVLTSLFGGLRHGLIDILIFNPPYVLTPDAESENAQANPGIHTALSGGIDGRLIIDQVIDNVNTYTSIRAIFYLVLVKENKVDNVCERMLAKGWANEMIMYRVCGWEGLHAFKFTRTHLNYLGLSFLATGIWLAWLLDLPPP